jgi:hypothetical protein
MKKTIILMTVLALAACNKADTADNAGAAAPEATTVAQAGPNAQAGFEAVAPGNYEIVRADGSIDRLVINPGMTWSMVSASNQPSGGTIFAQDGKNCFVTEGVEGHRCFKGEPPANDGSMKVIGDDGEVATVRPAKA